MTQFIAADAGRDDNWKYFIPFAAYFSISARHHMHV